ncbi:MAG: hypothetical protein Q9191_005880 [Dirinaria sp. TL-2023a]
MATLSKPPSQPRQTSRPNSTSSSSVITVQRAASLSSRNGSHPPLSGLRSQSPNENAAIPTPFSTRTLSPEPNRRASAIYPRSDSGHGVREGIGNLNRWSQSTVSSKSSSTHNRRNSISKRLSESFSSFGGFGSAQQSPSPNAHEGPKARPPPRPGPEGPPNKRHPTQPPPVLPPIVTLTSLSQAVDAADTPSTIATITPATADLLPPDKYTSGEPDYFGERWKAGSPSRPKGSGKRNPSATSPKANHTSPKRVQFENSSPRIPLAQASEPVVSAYSERGGYKIGQKGRRRTSYSGHSRNRDEPRRGSSGTEGESSASPNREYPPRNHRRKTPSQKAMLSKALQKANHAVQLDNAQNFEGAMEAYADACALLQQVMMRSSGDDDRRKLEAVRNTYTNRITELRNTDPRHHSADGKALPDKPRDRSSQDSKGEEPLSPLTDEEDDNVHISNATTTRITGGRPYIPESRYSHSRARATVQPPPRRQSLQPPNVRSSGATARSTRTQHGQAQRHRWAENSSTDGIVEHSVTLEAPRSLSYMPAPLSPRRPISPLPPPEGQLQASATSASSVTAGGERAKGHHNRQDTAESTSWLDTIDESGGSSSTSSVHSRSSSIGLRRKRIRAASGATHADFDAAFDAAVEAAYDDGFEPVADENGDLHRDEVLERGPFGPDFITGARRNLERARGGAGGAEVEPAVALVNEHLKKPLEDFRQSSGSIDQEYGDDEAEEEERLLDELSKDYLLDSSDYDDQAKSALPRQSDSSGFSGRTWGSSIGSNFASAGTSSSTVAETLMLPALVTKLQAKPLPPPVHPPPKGALPPPPQMAPGPAAGPPTNGTVARPASLATAPGVRDRRLSGMKVKQLKIETNTKAPPAPESAAPKLQPSSNPGSSLTPQSIPEPPQSAFAMVQSQEVSSDTDPKTHSLSTRDIDSRKGSSPQPTPSPADGDGTPNTIPATPALTKVTSADSFESVPSVPDSPNRFNVKGSTGPRGLKKNFSSSSLKNKILSVSVPEPSEVSPNPPNSSGSSVKQRRFASSAAPGLPPPTGASIFASGLPEDDIHVFDNDIHSPTSPGSPNPAVINAPLPLEPCPESSLLRPFWFLRCIYQTIAHPRGGYVSNRLFVPRDIWKVKTTKLKSVEEKVSSCDLLTATLLKLAKVDTLDADSVLKEMQFLEDVMRQTEATLSKRLGSEVGTGGGPWLSKGSKGLDDIHSTSETLVSKSTSTSTKSSYLSSWKKLRPKNSSAPGNAAVAAVAASKDASKDVSTLKSLPMTTVSHPKFPKRDLSQIHYGGPNSNYMAALAKLCDAVQVLDDHSALNVNADQIARQVEDPGLKHSSQTHVGLELSMQHAAEFFGLFVCRFVLNDVSLMLDKFIKRKNQQSRGQRQVTFLGRLLMADGLLVMNLIADFVLNFTVSIVAFWVEVPPSS